MIFQYFATIFVYVPVDDFQWHSRSVRKNPPTGAYAISMARFVGRSHGFNCSHLPGRDVLREHFANGGREATRHLGG